MPLIEITQSRYVSATIRLDSDTATLIDQYAATLHRLCQDRERAQPIIGVVSQVAAYRGRKSGAVSNHARKLPASHLPGQFRPPASGAGRRV